MAADAPKVDLTSTGKQEEQTSPSWSDDFLGKDIIETHKPLKGWLGIKRASPDGPPMFHWDKDKHGKRRDRNGKMVNDFPDIGEAIEVGVDKRRFSEEAVAIAKLGFQYFGDGGYFSFPVEDHSLDMDFDTLYPDRWDNLTKLLDEKNQLGEISTLREVLLEIEIHRQKEIAQLLEDITDILGYGYHFWSYCPKTEKVVGQYMLSPEAEVLEIEEDPFSKQFSQVGRIQMWIPTTHDMMQRWLKDNLKEWLVKGTLLKGPKEEQAWEESLLYRTPREDWWNESDWEFNQTHSYAEQKSGLFCP